MGQEAAREAPSMGTKTYMRLGAGKAAMTQKEQPLRPGRRRSRKKRDHGLQY